MTKLEAMALSEGLTRLVVGMETDLMKNIADFLAAGQAETSTALWKIKKLAELGALNKKNKRTIAEYAEIQPEMQQITLEAAAVKAVEQLEPGFRELVKEGVLKDASEMPMADTMMRAVKMLGKQAASDLNIVNTTMLYKAKKTAEKVINDTAELANKQDFLDSLNKAAGKVVTGIESRQAAMRQCIGEMTKKGIPAFTDKLGREWTPEAYTNMCIRTTVAKTATETQMERMNDYGVNLIAVSSHIGARPLCAPYQGRIFDRNNGSGYTTDLNDKKIRYEAWSSTSYGKPAGLLGINCGHQIYPFIPGINVQRYFPYDDEENAEQYKKLQKQRQLEREVRAAKRECTALDTVGDKAGFDEAAVRLKEKQQKLKDYCSSNGLTYKPDRTATPGYGKSEAAKVTASYKKSVELEKAQLKLDIDGESSIMKMGKVKNRQEAPDFSNYDIKEDLDSVVQVKNLLVKEFGLDENKVDLSGIKNSDVLEPFVKRLIKIKKETNFKLPDNIYVVDIIENDKCCIAGYKPEEKAFYISSQYFNSKKATLDALKQWSQNKVFPKQAKSIAYLAEHEAAHMMLPENLDKSKEAVEIWRKRKLINDNDEDISEYFADATAIYRINQNQSDANILNAIDYIRKEGIKI